MMQAGRIVYKTFETPLGLMVAAVTQSGCCLLQYEDRGGLDRIKKRILKRYGSEMIPSNSRFIDQVRAELDEYFSGRRDKFDVTLDLKGTPFQMTVWNRLLSIPYGETMSYGDLAAAIGKPKASRAVGTANGENYISIAVPCHRVIQHDGKLRGYGGGLWRKRYLLELEGSLQHSLVS